MPALPTLNLLSVSADAKSDVLPIEPDGVDTGTFNAALTAHLAQVDADSDAPDVAAFTLPFGLEFTDGEPLAGGVLVAAEGDASTQLPAGSTTEAGSPMLLPAAPALAAGATQRGSGLMPVPPAAGQPQTLSGEQQAAAAGKPAVEMPALHNAVATNSALTSQRQAPAQQRSLAPAEPGPIAHVTLPGGRAENQSGRVAAGTPVMADAALQSAVAAAVNALPGSPPPAASAGRELPSAPAPQSAQPIPVVAEPAILNPVRGAVPLVQAAASGLENVALTVPVDSGLPDSTVSTAYAPAALRETAAAQPATLSLARPMASPEWNHELSERVVWMAQAKQQSAEVQLNPRELGPMAIRVSVVDDVARVAFTAHHAITREALEAALPQLKDMFQSTGLTLGEASVSADNASARQQDGRAESGDRRPGGVNAEDDSADEPAQSPGRQAHSGLFEGYA